MKEMNYGYSRNEPGDRIRSDIKIILKRVDKKKLETWSPEQKQAAKNFISEVRGRIETFLKETENILTP